MMWLGLFQAKGCLTVDKLLEKYERVLRRLVNGGWASWLLRYRISPGVWYFT
jgi:hypothetical protein